MKFSLLALFASLAAAFILALSTVQVEARGICYDPQHLSPITAATVNADLNQIKSLGFHSVRTYVGQWGNMNLGIMIIDHGLYAAITIPYDNNNPGASEVHIQAAVKAGKHRNGGVRVDHIYVGNENLVSVNAVPQRMFEIIGYLKSVLPAEIKIGTVQRNTEYLDPSRNNIGGLRDLLAQCTIVGVNIHPVFTPNTRPENAIAQVDAQWRQLKGNVGGKFPGISGKLAITEIGWPTGGSAHGNSGSVGGAQRVFNDYRAWREKNVAFYRSFFFQMYDMPYRTDGPFENYFGIANRDRGLKFPIRV